MMINNAPNKVIDKILVVKPSVDYELLDSGSGEKLERYGNVVLSRPDPQVLWPKRLPQDVWQKADAVFEHAATHGKWKSLTTIPADWSITLGSVTCTLKLSPFKHVGVFPEQSAHWEWLAEKIQTELKSRASVSVLNLFGYTGGASIACAKAGAHVTHVDASESSVKWAKANRDASELSEDSIRFLVDDARKFVEREIRRGSTYDIIILDPPAYGRGAKNELWKLEDDLVPFLERLQKIISADPVAVILNGYASGYSHVAYAQALSSIVPHTGNLSSGELAIQESGTERLLPCGIFARWENAH